MKIKNQKKMKEDEVRKKRKRKENVCRTGRRDTLLLGTFKMVQKKQQNGKTTTENRLNTDETVLSFGFVDIEAK